MNILFTICGRAGSKGVRNKNLKDFLGVPLVYYTIAAIALYQDKFAANNKMDVTLNTDSEKLIELIKAQMSISVYTIKRDASLATDNIPKVAVVMDCLTRCEQHFGCIYDMVVDLDITSPLRTAKDVSNAIETKRRRSDTDVVYSVTQSRRNPYFNMVKEENGFTVPVIASEFTTRQQAPAIYDMNASIYAYSPKALRTKPSQGFFKSNCAAIKMMDTAVLDIDSEQDFELMEVIANHLFEVYPQFASIRDKALSFMRKS